MRSVRLRHEVRHATRDKRWKSRLKTKSERKTSLYGESTRDGGGGQKASCIVRKSDILTARLTSLSSRERWISVTRYVSLERIYFTADWCMKEYYFTRRWKQCQVIANDSSLGKLFSAEMTPPTECSDIFFSNDLILFQNCTCACVFTFEWHLFQRHGVYILIALEIIRSRFRERDAVQLSHFTSASNYTFLRENGTFPRRSTI